MMIRLALAMFAILASFPAGSHDMWGNEAPVPAWVKTACCGPSDVHHLHPEQVHTMPDGWHVDGVNKVIPYGTELPSQDGDYWVFYSEYAVGDGTKMQNLYCFFAPPRGM